jgi:hypothetical protein
VDLPNHRHQYANFPTHLVEETNLRPDLILETDSEVNLIELTSPMDSKIDYWHQIKSQKYASLRAAITFKRCNVFAIEVGALGSVASSVDTLLSHLKIGKLKRKKSKQSLSETALFCSKAIFDHRNRTDWPYTL